MQKITHRITVVSEGLIFEGYRTPRAFVWRETASPQPAYPIRSSQALRPTVAMVKSVYDWLQHANLSKEDKAICRRRVAGMSRREVLQLTRSLPGSGRSRPLR